MDEETLVNSAVKAGAVDGVIGKNIASVDGLNYNIYCAMIKEIF